MSWGYCSPLVINDMWLVVDIIIILFVIGIIFWWCTR